MNFLALWQIPLGLGFLASLSSAQEAPAAGSPPTSGPSISERSLELPDGGQLQFTLLRPQDFDAERSYPLLLALPPGAQNREMVQAGLDRYWGRLPQEHGWVVVSPTAPAGRSFFSGSEAHLPALLDLVASEVRIAGGRVHVAGPSNGGRSAFRLAGLHPERVASVMVLPGFPPEAQDSARLPSLLSMPVLQLVGGEDGRWVEASKKAHQALLDLGHPNARLTIFPGEGHVPASATEALVTEHLLAFHQSLLETEASRQAAGAALDRFHQAAAEADGDSYFASFAPGAVFLGTDPEERWTVSAFRAFAAPYFDRGQGWTYTPTRRAVELSPDGRTAWFDEDLQNDSYGLTRGTGVLRRLGKHWRIAQYSLSIPVPNDLTADLVERIRGR